MIAHNSHYVFNLFVAGNTVDSIRAKENIQQLCQKHLKKGYILEVIDVLDDPVAAQKNNVVVTPMLVVMAPLPRITILGDLSDTPKVLTALNLSRHE